jgi:eukaryotic-like serine/threonine-protein kinase
MGLATQILLGAAALVCCTLGPALYVGSRQAERIARTRITEELTRAPAVYEEYMSSQSAVRLGQVRAVARETGIKSLAGVDLDTYHDMAVDLARRLGADKVFLFDPRGGLLARTDRGPGEEAGRDFSPVSWVKIPLTRRTETSAVIFDVQGSRSLYLVASAPVTQGLGSEQRLNGVVAGAFEMGDAWVAHLGSLMSADVALVGNAAPRGAAPSAALLAATPGLRDTTLPHGLPDAAAFSDALFRKGLAYGPMELASHGRTLIGTALPIRSGGGEPIAAVVVARSKDVEIAAFRRTRRSLLVVGLALAVVALPASLLWAMSLSRPIRQLTRAAEDIGRGQLEVDLPRGWGEVGALARAFGSMVAELKAKAALEAVVAGRRPTDMEPALAPELGLELGPGGTFAGRYELLSVLGEGGMGTVYRARDRELDDEVALKVLKPTAGEPGAATVGQAPAAEMLRQEIKLARMVTHANVVRVHDFGENDGIRYFTMEYVPGTTLRELLGRQALPDLAPTLQIAKQVCRGLAAVHRAGIVHGDLKPQNVVVMGHGVVKLMDFGVARTRSALTRGEPLAGTPAYMSPEQARGAALDERSDLYSAGVLFFELFTGRCPFVGADAFETMRMHLDEAPPDPRRIRPHVPESLARIISKCLDKSPLRRPASAADLERLLMRVRL